jgi:hypothetical protein
LIFILDGSREMREGGLHLVHGHLFVTVFVIESTKLTALSFGDRICGGWGHGCPVLGLKVPSVQLRSFATSFAQRTRAKHPVATRTEVRLRDREVSKVGTEAVDCGLDGLKLIGSRGSRGSRIVW